MSRDAAGARFPGIGAGTGQASASAAADAWGWDKIFRAAAAERDDHKTDARPAFKPRQSLRATPNKVFAGIGHGFLTQPTAAATADEFVDALKAASPGHLSKVK